MATALPLSHLPRPMLHSDHPIYALQCHDLSKHHDHFNHDLVDHGHDSDHDTHEHEHEHDEHNHEHHSTRHHGNAPVSENHPCHAHHIHG